MTIKAILVALVFDHQQCFVSGDYYSNKPTISRGGVHRLIMSDGLFRYRGGRQILGSANSERYDPQEDDNHMTDEMDEYDDSDDDDDYYEVQQQYEANQKRKGSILSSPFLDHFQEEVHGLVSDYRSDVRKTFRELRESISHVDSSMKNQVDDTDVDDRIHPTPMSSPASHQADTSTLESESLMNKKKMRPGGKSQDQYPNDSPEVQNDLPSTYTSQKSDQVHREEHTPKRSATDANTQTPPRRRRRKRTKTSKIQNTSTQDDRFVLAPDEIMYAQRYDDRDSSSFLGVRNKKVGVAWKSLATPGSLVAIVLLINLAYIIMEKVGFS